MDLKELINYCINEKRTICLVGGGGKTSLMYVIAKEAAKSGRRVIVSTTTHIMMPEKNYAKDIGEVRKLWDATQYAVVGEVELCKLTAPAKDFFEELKSEADLILIEADGAKRLPCKVPADHEPVILKECDLVLAVMGMSALGKKLKDGCFRFETYGGFLGKNGDDIIDVGIAVKILSSKQGARKNTQEKEYIVVLNQCDNDELCKQAEAISDILKAEYNIDSVRCCLR